MGFFETGGGGRANGWSVHAATKGALPTSTYDNGTDGVGASLIADANGALPAIDGVTVVACNHILVKNQAAGLENGSYHVDSAGSGSTPWKLTRSTFNDQSTEFELVVQVGAGTQAGGWWIGTLLGDDPDGLVLPEPDVGTDVITPTPWPPKARNGQRVFPASAGSTGDVAGTYSNGPGNDGIAATLVGSSNGALAAQDGITLVVGDVLLLRAQSAGAENGLYIVDAVGDGSNIFELRRLHGVGHSNGLDGMLVYMQGGSTLAGRMYQQTAAAPTVGTTALVFAIFSSITSAAYTLTFATVDRTHAGRTVVSPSAPSSYTPHVPGGVAVLSEGATDLDTTAAALDTAIAELATLTTAVAALIVDQQDTAALLNAAITDLKTANILS